MDDRGTTTGVEEGGGAGASVDVVGNTADCVVVDDGITVPKLPLMVVVVMTLPVSWFTGTWAVGMPSPKPNVQLAILDQTVSEVGGTWPTSQSFRPDGRTVNSSPWLSCPYFGSGSTE